MTMDGNAVRSVDRAAALLLALGESAGEAGVTELARRLGLHKSTASRLLATLQRRGLVEQDDETGKYRLGLVVIRLAERAERTLDLRGIAMPELERLARLTHETTGLGVVNGDSLLTVSALGVKASRLSDLADAGWAAFPADPQRGGPIPIDLVR